MLKIPTIRTRTLDVLLKIVIVLLMSHVLAILVTGGYGLTILGITIFQRRVTIPIIILLVLIILRYPLKHGTLSWELLFSHEVAILFSLFLAFYLSTGKGAWSTDTLAIRYLPLSVLQEGNFDLDEFCVSGPLCAPVNSSSIASAKDRESSLPYSVKYINGHYISWYPIGAALLALPFYLPSALGHVSPDSVVIQDLEKLSAATIVALSAVVLYLLLKLITSRTMAILVVIIYACGTSSLSVSSQALWQHGPSQLGLTMSLYCLVRGRTDPRWIGYAGFPLAFAVLSRPTDIFIALSLLAYVLVFHRQHIVGFLLSGLPPVLFQLWYNATYWATPFHTQFPLWGDPVWSTPFWEGLAGILLSPSRGLFIYSPIFVFSLLGIALSWRRHGDPLFRHLSIGVLLTIFLYSTWIGWGGGRTYGPRLLADLTPALAVLLCPVKELLAKSRALKVTFATLLAWSIIAHGIGAFVDNASDFDPTYRLWSWTDNQLVNPFKKALNMSSMP